MAEWDWLWQKNKHKIIEMKERNSLPPFLQTQNRLICDLAVPSLTHQWFLLSFATEVVKTPLALSSHLSPTTTFIEPLLCCRHRHWQPVIHSSHKDVKSVALSFWFMPSVVWECMYGASMNPAVCVTFDVTGRTGDQLCPFPCFSLQEFYHFCP